MNDDIQPKIEGKAKKSRLAWKICGSSHSKLHSREPRLIQFCTLDSPQVPPKHNKTLQFRPTPILKKSPPPPRTFKALHTKIPAASTPDRPPKPPPNLQTCCDDVVLQNPENPPNGKPKVKTGAATQQSQNSKPNKPRRRVFLRATTIPTPHPAKRVRESTTERQRCWC